MTPQDLQRIGWIEGDSTVWARGLVKPSPRKWDGLGGRVDEDRLKRGGFDLDTPYTRNQGNQ